MRKGRSQLLKKIGVLVETFEQELGEVMSVEVLFDGKTRWLSYGWNGGRMERFKLADKKH